MKKAVLLLLLFCLYKKNAQSINPKFEKAFQQLKSDTLLQQANVSFCMVDAKTGKLIFEKNSKQLLPPASTIKTFTTANALHYLGANYQYKTKFLFKGVIKNDTALGELIIDANGDPSFGSDRFEETKASTIFKKIDSALKAKGIKHLKGNIVIENTIFDDEPTSKHWLEEDYGNYYGAGVFPFNWKENKFDIFLKTKQNTFEVIRNDGGLNNLTDFKIELIQNNLPTAKDAFAYIVQNSNYKYALRGEFPTAEKEQVLSLARINPAQDFKNELIAFLKKDFSVEFAPSILPAVEQELFTHVSPPLSQLVFWTNQKSLNLYAESFCKTIAYEKTKKGNWETGILYMKQFANSLGVDSSTIQLYDASGLSPENKVCTKTMSSLLFDYTQQKWFTTFYESLPIINNLKMKSGYIGGTRSYAGYMTLHDSTKTSFAFIVNNYKGKPKVVKERMFTFLDAIKN